MAEPMSLDVAYPVTTLHLVDLYSTTRPRLVALRDIAKPLALRRGSETVPAEILEIAEELLKTASHVVGYQRGARRLLHLPAGPDWTILLGKLEFALVALAQFRARYSGYDRDLAANVWRDEIWRDFHAPRPKSDNANKDLHEL